MQASAVCSWICRTFRQSFLQPMSYSIPGILTGDLPVFACVHRREASFNIHVNRGASASRRVPENFIRNDPALPRIHHFPQHPRRACTAGLRGIHFDRPLQIIQRVSCFPSTSFLIRLPAHRKCICMPGPQSRPCLCTCAAEAFFLFLRFLRPDFPSAGREGFPQPPAFSSLLLSFLTILIERNGKKDKKDELSFV